MEWHQKIRARREELGLSQADLAKAVDISQAAINKIENGLVAKSRFLPRISKHLGMDLSDLDADYVSDMVSAYRTGKILSKIMPEVMDSARHILFDGSDSNSPSGDLKLNYTYMDERGNLWLADSSSRVIQKPHYLADKAEVYAIVIEDHEMAPEFDLGDIGFFCADISARPGMTCLFISKKYRSPDGVLCKLRHLRHIDDNFYAVQSWSPRKRDENTEKLQLNDWYSAIPAVAKYYGSWPDL